MNRADIKNIVDRATGAPVSGPVADIVPAIVNALDAALNPAAPAEAKRTKRVIDGGETR